MNQIDATDDAQEEEEPKRTSAQGNLKPRQTTPEREAVIARAQGSQPPPSRARRVYLEVKQKEPFTGYCPVCMVDYVSGQQICTTCGFDGLPVDESGEVAPKEPNRRSRYLEKRAKKLAEFGIHGKRFPDDVECVHTSASRGALQ